MFFANMFCYGSDTTDVESLESGDAWAASAR